MMGSDEDLNSPLLHHTTEKFVSNLTRLQLQTPSVRPRLSGHVGRMVQMLPAVIFCKCLAKSGITVGFQASNAVVDVRGENGKSHFLRLF